MLVIGLTGGIGSGKSAASTIFVSLGARVLSADAIAARMTDSTPSLLRTLRRRFGRGIISADGTLDRSKLAGIVFRNPSRLRELNSIIHPLVIAKLRTAIRASRRRRGVMIVESALIYEAGLERLFDYVVVLASDRERRIARVMRRDRVARADVLRRMRAQHSAATALRKADFVIVNDRGLRRLTGRCTELYKLLRHLDRHLTSGRRGSSI